MHCVNLRLLFILLMKADFSKLELMLLLHGLLARFVARIFKVVGR